MAEIVQFTKYLKWERFTSPGTEMNPDPPKHIVIFASGGGTNAARIMAHFEGSITGKVVLVVTNNPHAGVIEKAKAAAVPVEVMPRTVWKDGPSMLKLLQKVRTDLIVLAGYLKKVPDEIITHYADRILNIHPSLLPKFGGKGMYGMRVHEAVIEAGEKSSGITIHRVNERYDEGEIRFQASLEIQPDWDATRLQQEVLKLEHQHFPEIIEQELAADGK